MVIRLLAAALLLAGGTACSDVRTAFAPDAGELPAGITGEPRPVTPEVTGLWMSGGNGQELSVIIRFSDTMDREDVFNKLFLRAATDRVRDRDDGNEVRISEQPQWNPTTTEVLIQAEQVAGRAVVVVLSEGVMGASGLALDGTSPPRPGTDPVSFHRVEDDGFLAPSTYVSLPYYATGSRSMNSHGPLLLSNNRPGIACTPFGGDEPVTSGSLGVYAGNDIRCRLHDRRGVPSRPGVAERRPPMAWQPGALPEAVFVRADGGVTVPATVLPGVAGRLPGAPEYLVQRPAGLNGVRLASLDLPAGVDMSDVYLVPAEATAPIWPVTGGTAPSTVWIAEVLYGPSEARDFGPADDGIGEVADEFGAAWVADEWAGQRFVNDLGTTRIERNRANTLRLATNLACGICPYSITPDIGERYNQGARVRLVTSRFVVRPAEALPAGEWRLELSGGRELTGLPQTDGIRDGNERTGTVDDTVSLLLQKN